MDKQLGYELFCRLLVLMRGTREGSLSYTMKCGGVITITIKIAPRLYVCKDEEGMKEEDAS